jgi:hypothetical protein
VYGTERERLVGGRKGRVQEGGDAREEEEEGQGEVRGGRGEGAVGLVHGDIYIYIYIDRWVYGE